MAILPNNDYETLSYPQVRDCHSAFRRGWLDRGLHTHPSPLKIKELSVVHSQISDCQFISLPFRPTIAPQVFIMIDRGLHTHPSPPKIKELSVVHSQISDLPIYFSSLQTYNSSTSLHNDRQRPTYTSQSTQDQGTFCGSLTNLRFANLFLFPSDLQ